MKKIKSVKSLDSSAVKSMNCSCRKPEFNSSTYVRPFVNTNIRRIWCFWPPPSLALIYIYKDTHTDTKFKKDLFKVNQGRRRHSGKFLNSQLSEGKGRQVSLGSRPALSTYTEFQTSLDCIMRPRQPKKKKKKKPCFLEALQR